MSCGKPLAHLWEEFCEKKKTMDVKKILDSFKIERACCRATLMGNVDLIDVAAKFKKA